MGSRAKLERGKGDLGNREEFLPSFQLEMGSSQKGKTRFLAQGDTASYKHAQLVSLLALQSR
ncbi:hypothetical protein A1QM_12090 [Vibrio genomosp. F10 str. 9ZC157]|nr:hypothetical protein A1QM_12090 [Vibrio genomosp. F10 str. 9ZC157]